MKVFQLIIIIFGFVEHIYCQNSYERDAIEQRYEANREYRSENKLDNLIKIQESIGEDLKAKCEKNGVRNASKLLEDQGRNVGRCLLEMREIFGDFCRNWWSYYKCLDNFLLSLRPCLNEDEKEKLDKALHVANKVLEFIRFNECERLATFIAKRGVECFQERIQAIDHCLDAVAISKIFALQFSSSNCNDLEALRSCTLKEFDSCEDNTTANIFNDLFKLVKEQTYCNSGNLSGCWSLTTVLLLVASLIRLQMY